MSMLIKMGVPWLTGLITLVVLDFVWIGLVASGLYRNQIGHLLNIVEGQMSVNIPAALATWVVIVTGIQLFVLPRTPANSPWLNLFIWGAVFGVIVYAVYDLTNYAVMKNWPLTVTLVDIAWGGFLCAITATSMGLANRVMTPYF